MRLKHKTLDIYGVEVYRVTTRGQWSKLRRKLDFLESGPNVDSLGSSNFDIHFPETGLPVPHVILWLDMKRITDQMDLVETCAHEASHAANQVLEYIGHDTRGVDEPHAYLVGWLTRWLIEDLI